jgi:outer membrane protein
MLVLASIAVAGCRSHRAALNQQDAPATASVPTEAASAEQAVRLAGCQQDTPLATAVCQPSVYQAIAIDAPSASIAEPLPPGPADVRSAMTLDEVVATAVDQNPRLRQAMARVSGASAGVDVAYAPFLPQVGAGFRYADFSEPVLPGGSFVPASLSEGVESFVIAEAGMQWTLYDFGRTQGRYGQAVDRERIEALALARAKQTIAFEAAQAYFRLLAAQANLKVRDEALQRANSVLGDTNVRFANGDADREDVLRAEVEVAQIQEGIFGARQAIRDAESTLNVVLGRSAAEAVTIEPIDLEPAFDESFESCLEIAANSRREIDMARRAVAEARHGLEAARGEMLPKIYVRSSVIRADSPGPLNGWIDGVGLHVDQWLYTGGAHQGEVRRSQAEISGAIAALQSLLDQVTLQVRVSFEAIDTDLARIHLGKTTVGQARENLRLTTVKYNNGTATPTDMVDAQTALIRAQSAYVTAVYSYLTDLAQLQYAMGNDQSWLLDELKRQEMP